MHSTIADADISSSHVGPVAEEFGWGKNGAALCIM